MQQQQQRIRDLRPVINNIEEADQVMAEIARLECNIAVIEARAEKRIAAIKHDTALDTEQSTALLKSLKSAMGSFIEANRVLFEKPRKRKTPSGTYGLQKVTELVISNAEELIEEIMDRGYDNCIKIVRTPVKPAILQRMEDGEKFRCCSIFSGDAAVCKVTPAIIKDAKENL